MWVFLSAMSRQPRRRDIRSAGDTHLATEAVSPAEAARARALVRNTPGAGMACLSPRRVSSGSCRLSHQTDEQTPRHERVKGAWQRLDAASARPHRLPAGATPATATILARPRLVHAQGPAVHVVTIERRDRLGGVFLAHLNKAKAARALGFAVERQRAGEDFAVCGEQRAQVLLARTVRQIPNVDFLRQRLTLLAGRRRPYPPAR